MSTLRQLPLSRLGHLVPPLVDGAALVVLVAMSDDLAWAAKAAWDIARIAARDGRRVALVDLELEHPALHEIVGLQTTEGIVDAFEYGVSLNKAAHEVHGVFLIPAGTDTAKAQELYAHSRWRKLQAGFRSEGALLLVFMRPGALAQFAAEPDGVIVLAPEGVNGTLALRRDLPLLGVVRDRWLPSGPQGGTGARVSSPAQPMPGSPTPPPSPLRSVSIPIDAEPSPRTGVRVVLAAGLVVALGLGGWTLFARAKESGAAGGGFVAPPAPPVPPAPPSTSSASTNLQSPPARADTLAWTVQLAAYASVDKALAQADRLAVDAGVPTLVTPVPQSDHGRVWYRVLAGSYATRAAAGEARAGWWQRGVTAEGIGDLVRAPYSYHAAAGASLDMLRRRGLPAVRWTNGAILLGAFETPDQAAYTQAALKRAGVRANLLPRMGTP